MRSAETAARGTMTNMNTAIMTENRICMRYWRKAVRLPIGISPLSTRMAPNHMTATVDRLMIADQRRDHEREEPVDLERRVGQVRGSPSSKRRSSWSRAHERADDADAGERLAHDLVDPVDLDLHRPGRAACARPMTRPMTTTMIGQDDEQERRTAGTSWRRAMMMPPTTMIGAEIIIVRPMRTTIWTCCTSLVLRVMSDGVPKWLTSTCEKVSTVRKIALRTSRPKPIAIAGAPVDGDDRDDAQDERDAEHHGAGRRM